MINITDDIQHMHIWEKVVDLKMIMLREIASEPIMQTLSIKMPKFHQMYKSELMAKKSSDGEARAVRWLLERLQKSKDTRWPGVLQEILKCNDALLEDVRREFWIIHNRGKQLLYTKHIQFHGLIHEVFSIRASNIKKGQKSVSELCLMANKLHQKDNLSKLNNNDLDTGKRLSEVAYYNRVRKIIEL